MGGVDFINGDCSCKMFAGVYIESHQEQLKVWIHTPVILLDNFKSFPM